MTARERIELVHSNAGWFARCKAGNGKETWRTSETYVHKAGARNAIVSMTGCPLSWVEGRCWAHRCGSDVEVIVIDLPRRP